MSIKFPKAHTSVGSEDNADAFLQDSADKQAETQKLNVPGDRTSNNRPKSMAERESGIRDSLGYALKNKYGESARDDTDSEPEDPVDKHLSVKQR